jgi:hypothetical protein
MGQNMRTIMYGIDRNTGLVWSRIGSQVAIPVLQFDKMTPDNNFQTIYELEKMDVIQTAGQAYNSIVWTRKIPTELKNRHRQFWGLKPLGKRNEQEKTHTPK